MAATLLLPASVVASAVGQSDIAAGLKEALSVGTTRVVGKIGRVDGFNADPAIHIPLPGGFQTVKSAMDGLGMGSMVDDLELRLNRAAESAVPLAKDVFIQAIGQMTLTDAEKIYTGPTDSATQYFKHTMTPLLTTRMTPIVEKSLADAGAIKAFDDVMQKYSAVPFMPNVKADLTSYGVQKTLDGMFYYVGKEEAAIRTNPGARTTDLLKRVFGVSS